MITAPIKPNQVFIFGSNLAGKHLSGTALYAYENFGAEEGVAEGLVSQSYAFPSLDENLNQRSLAELNKSVDKLFQCALENPDKEFLLTKVGCGVAGYDEGFMRELFNRKDCPLNIKKPEDWSIKLN